MMFAVSACIQSWQTVSGQVISVTPNGDGDCTLLLQNYGGIGADKGTIVVPCDRVDVLPGEWWPKR